MRGRAGGLLGRMLVNVSCFSFGFDFSICQYEKVLNERTPSGGSGPGGVNTSFLCHRHSPGSVQVINRKFKFWRLQSKPLTCPSVLCSRPYRMAEISRLTPRFIFSRVIHHLLTKHAGF